MSILSVLVTKVRGWTPRHTTAPAPRPAHAPAKADRATPDDLTRRPVRAFTPAFCTKLAECDPARVWGD